MVIPNGVMAAVNANNARRLGATRRSTYQSCSCDVLKVRASESANPLAGAVNLLSSRGGCA
jgi:hypothetical protein